MSNEPQSLNLDEVIAQLYAIKKARDSSPPTTISVVPEEVALARMDGRFLDEPRYTGFVEIERMPDGTERRGKSIYYKIEAVLPVI